VMRRQLANCLLTDEEYAAGPAAWRLYDNPFQQDDVH